MLGRQPVGFWGFSRPRGAAPYPNCMSLASRARKAAEKKARFDAIMRAAGHDLREDDKAGDDHRAAAAHAHVMTHHALEMDTPSAHEAAAAAHDKVADMHRERAEEYPSSSSPSGAASSARSSK